MRNALAAVARDLRATCGGRAAPAENIHVTLAFLGAVAETRLPELQAMAAGLQPEAFVMTLSRLGCWRKQRLAWAALQECPPALTALAEGLGAALQARGFRTERRAFKPHVTLLREVVAAPPLTMAPLQWQVRQFVLAASEPAPRGVHYRIIGEWPLAGPAV